MYRSTFAAAALALMFAAGPVAAQAPDGPSMARQHELQDLAWPLQVSAADRCNAAEFLTGVEVFATPDRGAYIAHVVAGSPAQGQVNVGDRVGAYNGQRLSSDAPEAFQQWMDAHEEQRQEDGVQSYVLVGAAGEQTITVQPRKVCRMPIRYIGRELPTLDNGDTLLLTPSFDALTPEPWMAQAQLAHQIGHRIRNHEQKRSRFKRFAGIASSVTEKVGGFGIGSLGGIVGANALFGKQHELDADKVALELTTQIGLDPQKVVTYWTDIIQADAGKSKAAQFLSKHPTHPERVDALNAQLAEIAQAGGANDQGASAP